MTEEITVTDSAPTRHTGRVAFAVVRGSVTRPGRGRAPLPQPDLAAGLLGALQAGTQVEVAEQRWHVDAAKHEDRWISGRLVGEDLPGPDPRTVSSPFVADLRSGRLAFQLRRPRTHPRAAAAVFRALLERAVPNRHWQVVVELTRVPWADWRRSVERLRELRLLLRRPNPDYGDRHQVQALIESTNAELLRMVLEADPDSLEGIDVDAELVAEAIDHVRAGYGDFVAVGDTGDHGSPHVTSWQYRHGGAPLQTQVPLSAATSEVEHEVLRRELEATESSPDRVPVPDRAEPDADLEAWAAEE